MMKTVLTAIAWCLLLLAPRLAHSRDVNFVTIEVAPWAWTDAKTGKKVGLFPSVVHELERRTGHKISMSLQPFARLDHELESGNQDCTIIVWTDERGRIVDRGALVSNHEIGVIARKDLTLSRYEDLHGAEISVLRGLSLGAQFDEDRAIKKDFDTDYITGINKVAHHRIDGVAGATHTIQYLINEHGLQDVFGPVLKLGTIPLVLQCAKKSKNLDLMPAFNHAIRDMWADGTLHRLEQEY